MLLLAIIQRAHYIFGPFLRWFLPWNTHNIYIYYNLLNYLIMINILNFFFGWWHIFLTRLSFRAKVINEDVFFFLIRYLLLKLSYFPLLPQISFTFRQKFSSYWIYKINKKTGKEKAIEKRVTTISILLFFSLYFYHLNIDLYNKRRFIIFPRV